MQETTTLLTAEEISAGEMPKDSGRALFFAILDSWFDIATPYLRQINRMRGMGNSKNLPFSLRKIVTFVREHAIAPFLFEAKRSRV
ncbi:MAG: hypothetical protein JRI79_15045 [Deltaproteobacteria bacterium]|nr:hypothetical protein [Deltaproteobacteria bacterium]